MPTVYQRTAAKRDLIGHFVYLAENANVSIAERFLDNFIVPTIQRGNDEPGNCIIQGAMNMKCPVCGAMELVPDTRDMPYTYKGETTVITDVTGDFCPACAEVILDAAQADRYSAAIREFNKQVNAAIVDPIFIANTRKKLALDQREAAEIFGGGVNAFSRYETGKTKPPLALIKLFKLLDRYPELLNDVNT